MTTNQKGALLHRFSATLVSCVAAGGLVACGGSGGDGGGASLPGASPQSITLQGTAAEGAPLVGQPVSVKCVGASATAVTGSDGSYSVVVPAAAWPCMAQVSTASNGVLTTIARASGTTAIANITPATQLVVATLIGSDPAAYFQTFDNATVAAITGDTIAAAQQKLIATLASAGVDFTAVGDLLASEYTAAYDAVLVTLSTQIAASGSTLDALAAAIEAAATPAAISVAANLLLQPAAANCSGLRSAAYRVLTPTPGAALSAQSSLLTLDASTLTVTRDGQPSATWVANGACRFTEQAGTYSADVTVTQAGVLVARYTNDGVTFRSYVGLPVQAHTLGDLKGTWNLLGMRSLSATNYAGTAGTLTYDDQGAVTAATQCQNDATWAVDTCETLGASLLAGIVPLAVDSTGGFDITNPDSHAVTGRMFAFRPGSGDLMLATVTDKGEFFVSAAIEPVAIPAAGLAAGNWNLDNFDTLLSASPVYVTSTTVTAVDAASGSWTRSRLLSNGATRPETLFANSPRTGYIHRPGATVADSTGAPSTVNEFTALSVPGTGLSPLFLTTGTKLFELSARLP